MADNLVDVCLFCAMRDEVEALLKVFNTLGSANFKKSFSSRGRECRQAVIQNNLGESLSVHVSLSAEMGSTSAATHILSSLQEFEPRFAGMTGICAGDREKVALGDLIVATRAYEYDVGKMIIGEDGIPKHQHDVKTWSPSETIIQYVQLFDDWKKHVAGLRRPPSKRQQRDWLLSELLRSAGQVDNIPKGILEENAPDWQRIVAELKAGNAPWIAASGYLTDFARGEKLNSFPFRDRGFAEQHAGVMGSGRAVRADNPFSQLRQSERKLIALDMEGAMLYQSVANVPECAQRGLVVKGVSDYGDSDKDDSYRSYACEASAIYMYCFIVEYVNGHVMPRLHAGSGPQVRDDPGVYDHPNSSPHKQDEIEEDASVTQTLSEVDTLAGINMFAARDLILRAGPETHHLLASKLEEIRRRLRATGAYVLPSGEHAESFEQMSDAVLRNPEIGSLIVKDPLLVDWLSGVVERPDLVKILRTSRAGRWETLLQLIDGDARLPQRFHDAVSEFRKRDEADLENGQRDVLLQLLSRDPDCLSARLRLAGSASLPSDEVICLAPEYKDQMGLRFVKVPAGTASIGGTHSSLTEHYGTRLELHDPFWISQTPVTVGAYAMRRPTAFQSSGERHLPVVDVGWHAAADYCKEIGGRLPTEVEWEYAASGGLIDCLYPWGNQISPAHALYDLTASFPWRKLMRKFFPNRFGLFDMVGGVWEWCSDGRSGRKIIKGGSWRSKAEELQLSHRKERHIDLVGAPLDDTGFRCVLL